MDRAPNRFRAVSFDGDGTLWDFDKVMRRALQAVLDELARIAGPSRTRGLTVDALKEIRDALAQSVSGRALDHHRLRRESFAVLLRDLDLYDDALHARLCDVFFENRYAALELYEDTRAVLPGLRDRFRVALISNGNSDPKRFGLDRYFDTVIFDRYFDTVIFAERFRCREARSRHLRGDRAEPRLRRCGSGSCRRLSRERRRRCAGGRPLRGLAQSRSSKERVRHSSGCDRNRVVRTGGIVGRDGLGRAKDADERLLNRKACRTIA